jgi:predicted phage terminase large subunit-like protein
VDALHQHHDASVFLIVKSRQQCFAVPVDGAFAHDIGKGICKLNRIVDNEQIAAEPRERSVDRGRIAPTAQGGGYLLFIGARVMSWDIAMSEAETGDYSAGVVLLNRGQTFYVLEVLRGRFRFPQLVDKIVDMCTRYRGTLLIEDSPISKGLIQSLRNNNVNVVTVTVDKEKRSRVIAQSDLFEGGSIFIKENAEWREIFIRELLDFPGGRHDDQVDALVQGLAYQRGQWPRELKVRSTTGY